MHAKFESRETMLWAVVHVCVLIFKYKLFLTLGTYTLQFHSIKLPTLPP